MTNLERPVPAPPGDEKRPLVFAGFDGFIDEVVHVVDVRADCRSYSRVETIERYAKRIAAAAGLSTNIEYVTVQTKMGGNGAIYANALLQLGGRVRYVGALGDPVEPIYRTLVEMCEAAVSIAPCAHTDAVEFLDGKLIISKLDAFKRITYRHILDVLGPDGLFHMMSGCQMLSFMNWTMIPGMSGIFEGILEDVLPRLSGAPYTFFDLADPEKRSDPDLSEALALIRRFQGGSRAILAMNLKEAMRVAEILNVRHGGLEELTRGIHDAMGIHAVVVHPVKEACCVVEGAYAHARGPYCAKPALTTGAGDNFNAGFCSALLGGNTARDALLTAVAASGYYVRNSRSPTMDELAAFKRSWERGLPEP